MTPIGIYLHVPFCAAKCPYCDFYSMPAAPEVQDQYTKGIIQRIESYSDSHLPADTVYFGGGTPGLLGAERLGRILSAVRRSFDLAPDAEVTVETNPGCGDDALFDGLAAAGVTRISLGLQSANADELRLLGRRHTAKDAARAVELAHRAGIENVSLDLMIATPGQTQESLRQSIAFCAHTGASHVSAYLLKIESGTDYGRRQDTLDLPGEDEVCDLYETACTELERLGYAQYEISNFSRPGRESRHNLKYWRCEEYLGFGPAAHSFFEGRRFFFPRDLGAFLRGDPPVDDGEGGDFEEFAMLALRLCEGLREDACRERFGHPIPAQVRRKAVPLERAGCCRVTPEGISLTRAGFLVSNAVIGALLL